MVYRSFICCGWTILNSSFNKSLLFIQLKISFIYSFSIFIKLEIPTKNKCANKIKKILFKRHSVKKGKFSSLFDSYLNLWFCTPVWVKLTENNTLTYALCIHAIFLYGFILEMLHVLFFFYPFNKTINILRFAYEISRVFFFFNNYT